MSPFLTIITVFVWASLSTWLFRYLRDMKSESPKPISLLYTIAAFTLFLVAYAIIIPLLKDLLPIDPSISSLVLFACIFFAFTIMTAKVLPFQKPFKSLVIGMTSYLLIYPFIFLLAKTIELILKNYFGIEAQEQEAIQVLKAQKENIGLIVFITIIIPIIEEILFRGYLLQGLKSVLKPSWSIALTALVFAFFHFSAGQGFSNITIIVSLFMLACFMGYLVEKTGSLWSSIGLHMAFNSISSFFIIKGLS